MKYLSTPLLALLLVATPFAVFAEDSATTTSDDAIQAPMYGPKPKIEMKGSGHAVISNVRITRSDDHGTSTESDEDHIDTPKRMMASTTREDDDSHPKLDGAKVRAHDDLAIDARINKLTALIARLGDAQRLSPEAKTTITATLNAQIDALKALKAKIAAGDTTTLKDDSQSITKSFRIYALVLPKAAITAAADRIMTISGQMEAFSAKITARIDAAATAGADVSVARTASADFSAKIADAKVQAQAAIALVANLSVDEGDKTKLEANTAALKEAKTKIDAAQADLKAARKDIGVIMGSIKGKGEVKTEASDS